MIISIIIFVCIILIITIYKKNSIDQNEKLIKNMDNYAEKEKIKQ